MIFFIIYFLERLGHMHENKTFVFMKTRYLIPDLYLYNIKIQTNIDQNAENH